MKNKLPRNNNFFVFLGLLLFLAHPMTAQNLWEGNAAVGGFGLLPIRGFYGASNSFPQNTLIRVENLDNGRQVELLVVERLENNNLLVLLSQEAAGELGINAEGISRVRATLSSGDAPYAHVISEDRPLSLDPDQNPASALAGENDTESLLALSRHSREDGGPVDSLPSSEPAPYFDGPDEDLGPIFLPAQPDMEDNLAEEGLSPEDYPGEEEPEPFLVDAYGLSREEPWVEEADTEASGPEESVPVPEIWVAEALPEEDPSPEVPQVEDLSLLFLESWEDEYNISDLPEEPAGEPSLMVMEDDLFDSVVAEVIPPEAPDEIALVEDELPPYEVPPLFLPDDFGPPEDFGSEEVETEITLVPAEERPPQVVLAPEEEPEKDIPGPAFPSESLFPSLERGRHYVQIGAFADENGARTAISQLPASLNLPIFIWSASGTGAGQYRVMVGPLNSDESGAMLYNLRGWGYRDAFIRKW